MNKNKTKHSITKIYKTGNLSTEIDLDLYDKMLDKDWSSSEYGIDTIKLDNDDKYGWQGESEPIEIDKLISILNDIKTKGSNYVEIVYHHDHIGYYFYGLDIHRSTNKEIINKKKRFEKENKILREQKIKELETELKKLKTIK